MCSKSFTFKQLHPQWKAKAPSSLLALLESMKIRHGPETPTCLWIRHAVGATNSGSEIRSVEDLSLKICAIRSNLLAIAGILGVPYTFSGFHEGSIIQNVIPKQTEIKKVASSYKKKKLNKGAFRHRSMVHARIFLCIESLQCPMILFPPNFLSSHACRLPQNVRRMLLTYDIAPTF